MNTELKKVRQAVIVGGLRADLRTVQSYLPSNYAAARASDDDPIVITGRDSHGWTLDTYVIPRLLSALIFVREVL